MSNIPLENRPPEAPRNSLDEGALASRARAVELRLELSKKGEQAWQQFDATKISIKEMWARLLQSHEGSSLDRNLRRAALNLLEDAELARRREEEEAASRERAEAARRASEARYGTLFESIDEAFCMLELLFDQPGGIAVDYRFVEVNPAFQRHTGIAATAGRTVSELAPGHADFWFQIYSRIELAGGQARFESRSAALGRDFDVYAFRTGEPPQHRMAVLFKDITERKAAEEALRRSLVETQQARSEAEAAGKAKDHFLAVLSHELRTPLMPVLMVTRTILRQKSLPSDIREGLETIERNIQIESRMINELLDLTRIERGKMELHRERTDVHESLRHALEVAAPDIEEKQQKLVVNLAPGSAVIQADAMRIQQAFWNVLKNASKFTPECGEIRVESTLENDQITITVSDTGVGIPADAINKIFDPFSQADETIARQFGGLGIGLSLVRATVEGHGGTIVAQSDGKDRGSTFTIHFPLSNHIIT